MSKFSENGQSPQINKPVQLAVVKQFTTPNPELLNHSLPPYWDKPLPPGLDPHLDKDELRLYFKLTKTLIHKKLDKNSEEYDEDFPAPVHPSPRKPVWILSELITWQEKLKAKRSSNAVQGVQK